MLCQKCVATPSACNSCGTAQNPIKFCFRCGHTIPEPIKCGACKTLLPHDASFCYKCGASQSPEKKEKDDITIQNRATLLKRVPLLSHIDDEGRFKLSSYLTVQSFSDRQIIFNQGDPANGFYLLVDGDAVVTMYDAAIHSNVEVGQLGAGDYFGETALLANTVRTATVSAKGHCRTLFLDKDKFHSLFGNENIAVSFATRRVAISAEQFSQGQSDEVKRPAQPQREMSRQVKTMLIETISSCPLFSDLDLEHKLAIVQSMYAVDLRKGAVAVRQKELGTKLYCVEKGSFEVTIASDNGPTRAVATIGPKQYFGELALMYNAPRAATVTAIEDSVVWVVDRFTVASIAKNIGSNKMEQYMQLLRTVKILAPLTESERRKIAEALDEVSFPRNSLIFAQHSPGDAMYIVTKGNVQIDVDGNQVGLLKPGDYFGELALLNDSTRAASATSLTEVECLKLDRHSFKLLLGPVVQTMLNRATSSYGSDVVYGRRTSAPEVDPNLAARAVAASGMSSSTSSASAPAVRELLKIKKEDLTPIATLGKGSFGHVMLVRDAKGIIYALKGVNKQQIVDTQQQGHILSEKSALEKLNHPFVIRLYATFKTQNKLYFLLEPVLGGELFTFLRKQKYFCEDWARFYAAIVLSVFEYMHRDNIAYRDLKPENLLLDDNGYLKVTDFGFAKQVVGKTWTLCGTPDYLAPEIVASKGHNKAVDYWTLGVLIFEMLAAYPPFYDEDPMRTYSKIVESQYTFPSHFSHAAKSLISKLLVTRPSQRLGCTAEGCTAIKEHEWFKPINFEDLYHSRVKAPYIPPVSSKTDVSNFVNYGNIQEEEIPYKDDGSNWDATF